VTGGLFWWHDNLNLVQRSEQVAQISVGLPTVGGFDCRANPPVNPATGQPAFPANTFYNGAVRPGALLVQGQQLDEQLCLSPSVPSTQPPPGR